MMLARRDVLRGMAGLALAACSKPGGEAGALRVAYLGNLTHAPVISGVDSGRIAAALGPLRLETRIVNAGPRVVEGLLGGSVDIGVMGPAAIIASHALHGPRLSIVSGVCSGGASFVLRKGQRVDDLADRTLATPQIGSTQDVSLRKHLRVRGYTTRDHGGDVRVTQLPPALARLELARGALDGAWMPEPWASRFVLEAPAFRAIDERELWPSGEFATAIVVVRSDFLRLRADDVHRFTSALDAEIATADREASRAALSHTTHATWQASTWAEAWARVRFTSDSMRGPIAAFARDAVAIGALRTDVDTSTLFAT